MGEALDEALTSGTAALSGDHPDILSSGATVWQRYTTATQPPPGECMLGPVG